MGDCLQQRLGLAVSSPEMLGKSRMGVCGTSSLHVGTSGPFLPTRLGQRTFSTALGMLVHSGLGTSS